MILSLGLFACVADYREECVIRVLFPESAESKYTADALNALTKTHAAMISSKSVLYRVIDNLLLTGLHSDKRMLFFPKMTEEKAYQILKAHLSVVTSSDAVGIITIQFRSPHQDEAANVVNAIANAYADEVSKSPTQISGVRIVPVQFACPNAAKKMIRARQAEQDAGGDSGPGTTRSGTPQQ
jgi:hypothetical protein